MNYLTNTLQKNILKNEVKKAKKKPEKLEKHKLFQLRIP